MRNIIFLIIFLLALIAGGIFVLRYKQMTEYVSPIAEIRPINSEEKISTSTIISTSTEAEKPVEEEKPVEPKAPDIIEKPDFLEIEKAKTKSSQVRGIYVGSANNQKYFKELLDKTELNGVVIDVKEARGINMPNSLKNLISELHQNENWVIARIVIFRDSSLVDKKPEWYLMATSSPWRDGAGSYWLDPNNPEVQDYIIEFSKKVIDFGFDELQFDYIRYPDNYNNGAEKYKVIGDFSSKLSEILKSYKPEIILSADLFGYVASQFNSFEIGQRLIDAGGYFDYLSFMLYPSHFYGGFASGEARYSYPDLVEKPYEIVYYSIVSAYNYLAAFSLESKIRPWLQDFNLKIDSDRGVVYDADKVRAQIQAAENATSSGWLLWNPSGIYTSDALTPTASTTSTE